MISGIAARIEGAPLLTGVVFIPAAGTAGHADLRRTSEAREVAERLVVQVGSPADVVRSKQAAARAKGQAALPLLRDTLDIRRGRERDEPRRSR